MALSKLLTARALAIALNMYATADASKANCGCFEFYLEADEISVEDDEHVESMSIHLPGYTDSETGCFKWIKK